jgi:hypothetical protein
VNVDIGVALIAAVTALVVGYLSGRQARHIDRLRYRRERASAAYSEYLSCVGEMETTHAGDIDALQRAKGRAIAAKARVCLDGSAEVVKALADFESRGMGQMRTTMFHLVQAMRRDIETKGDVLGAHVSEILFGPPAA